MFNESSPFVKSTKKVMQKTGALYSREAQMLYAYTHGGQEDAYKMAIETEREAESMMLTLRDLPLCTGCPSAAADVEMAMAEVIPVEMGYTEQGWFAVRMPWLLPIKEKGSVKYIRGYLYPALNRFFQHSVPRRFDRCVIIFRHVYDRKQSEKQYRDHDNIETNFVVDALALYVMVDDSPLRCQHHYCSAEGSQNRTEVYVVPEHDFFAWYKLSKSIPEEGVMLYDSPPIC